MRSSTGDTIRVFETFGARPVFPEGIDCTEQMLYSDARPCLSEAAFDCVSVPR